MFGVAGLKNQCEERIARSIHLDFVDFKFLSGPSAHDIVVMIATEENSSKMAKYESKMVFESDIQGYAEAELIYFLSDKNFR
jgi:hypothetical protein